MSHIATHSISGFFRNDRRSMNPWPFAPMRPTRILSFGEIAALDFDIVLKGITLPAARTDAVLMKFRREELIADGINFTGKVIF
jgi:hypothetical protein